MLTVSHRYRGELHHWLLMPGRDGQIGLKSSPRRFLNLADFIHFYRCFSFPAQQQQQSSLDPLSILFKNALVSVLIVVLQYPRHKPCPRAALSAAPTARKTTADTMQRLHTISRWHKHKRKASLRQATQPSECELLLQPQPSKPRGSASAVLCSTSAGQGTTTPLFLSVLACIDASTTIPCG